MFLTGSLVHWVCHTRTIRRQSVRPLHTSSLATTHVRRYYSLASPLSVLSTLVSCTYSKEPCLGPSDAALGNLTPNVISLILGSDLVFLLLSLPPYA